MKKGQFTEEQIVRILQQAERGAHTIGAICRKHGIAENTFARILLANVKWEAVCEKEICVPAYANDT